MEIKTLVKLLNILRYGRVIRLAIVATLLLLGFAIGNEAVYAKRLIDDEEDAAM